MFSFVPLLESHILINKKSSPITQEKKKVVYLDFFLYKHNGFYKHITLLTNMKNIKRKYLILIFILFSIRLIFLKEIKIIDKGIEILLEGVKIIVRNTGEIIFTNPEGFPIVSFGFKLSY
ncbi:MAG: hypothetical protein KAT05_09875 [Spirochaetes bacterium]|nr:hypothetical protein [Spirochaetota bacterium]